MMDHLSKFKGLGALLEALHDSLGGYEVVEVREHGELHHDLLLRVQAEQAQLPGEYLVVAINCNGGIRELMSFDQRPQLEAVQLARVPGWYGFANAQPRPLETARAAHQTVTSLEPMPGLRSALAA